MHNCHRQSLPVHSQHTPQARELFQQAAPAASEVSEVSAATGILPTALPSLPTPLLTPMAHPQETGPLSQPPTASHQAHGAVALPQVAGQPSSPAGLALVPEVAAGDQAAVVHSVVLVLEDGDSLVHGPQVDRGLLDLGLAGGTRTRAPSQTGQAGPAVPGPHLPLGLHGLPAAHPLLLLAPTPQPPTVSHTPLLASDTSLRRSRARARAQALNLQGPTTPTALPLQVVRLLLPLWVSLPCYKWICV